MYAAIKTNKINKNFFYKKKTRHVNLIKCIYLYPSKLTERHIAIKTNEKKHKK